MILPLYPLYPRRVLVAAEREVFSTTSGRLHVRRQGHGRRRRPAMAEEILDVDPPSGLFLRPRLFLGVEVGLDVLGICGHGGRS